MKTVRSGPHLHDLGSDQGPTTRSPVDLEDLEDHDLVDLEVQELEVPQDLHLVDSVELPQLLLLLLPVHDMKTDIGFHCIVHVWR